MNTRIKFKTFKYVGIPIPKYALPSNRVLREGLIADVLHDKDIVGNNPRSIGNKPFFTPPEVNKLIGSIMDVKG